MKRLFIETSKGQLHARSHTGDPPFATPPLVMLHAAPGSALMLSNLQVRFKQRSLAIDLPGMGDSDPLPIRADKESEQLDELLADYAPDFTPDINGNHLMNTFQLCRDQYLFYPWYARDAEHRRPTGLPSAAALHTKVMESLKSAVAFRPLIRAAFRYDCAAALAALKQPALITADGSAVRGDLPLLEFPPAEPLTCAPDLLDKRAARIAAFLDS